MEAQMNINREFGSIYQQTTEATKAITDSADKGISLKQSIEKQKLLDENQAINVGKVLAAALGADPKASNYRMEQLAKTRTQASNEALAATAEYEQLASTSFLDNPLEWLVNQFQKDAVAEKANAASNRAEMATQEMRGINYDIQQGVLTNKIVSETVNEDLTAKKLELQAISNKQAADQLKLDAIGKNSDALKAVMTGNNAMMSAAQHQESAILQQQQMAQAERHFQVNVAMAKERFNLDKEQFEEVKKQHDISNDFKQQSMEFTQTKWDAKQEDHANKLILDLEDRMSRAEKAGRKEEAAKLKSELVTAKQQFALDKAVAIQQGKQDTVNRYKQVVASISANSIINIPDNIYDAEKVINEGIKLAKNPQDAYGLAWKAVRDSMASVVLQTKADPSKHPVVPFGFVPTDAINALQVLQPKLTPQQERTAIAVANQIKKEEQALKQADPNISAKELRAKVDYNVAQYFADTMKDPESSDLTKLPKPVQLAEFASAKKSRFFNEYIKPKIEVGDTDTSFEEISKLATKALLDKKMNINELAKDLSQLYSEGLAYNNAVQGYSRFGIPMLNKYMIRGVGERELDMTDPTDVKTALIFQSLQSSIGGGILKGAAPAAFNWLAGKVVDNANPEDATRR